MSAWRNVRAVNELFSRSHAMRKFLEATALLAGVLALSAIIGTAAKAQPYYGGMMGGYGYGQGYGMGPGMMGGYGPGYGRMGGYGPGYMMGPGYGYGSGGYGNNETYRGKRLCWHPTDSDGDEGYYAPCK
jgi:hypothetical protein